ACAGEKQTVHSLKTALRHSALRYDAPESLRNAIRRKARTSVGTASMRFNPLLLWKSLAFGATALAFLVILLRPAMSDRNQLLSDAVASHVRSLMVENITDVSLGDDDTVKAG